MRHHQPIPKAISLVFQRLQMANLVLTPLQRDRMAPGLVQSIGFFNALTRFCVTEIASRIALKTRAQALAACVQLAARFRELNNFNGLMSVLSALNSAPIRR